MKTTAFICISSISLALAQDKGQTLYQEGKFDEARKYYERILRNREKDDAARFGLGTSAYQQKDFETAARVFNNVMRTKDKSLQSKALYNIGTLFNEQQKMEESLAFFRKAIESDPLNEDAKVNYELLKRHLQQQQQDQQQNSNQNQDSKDQQNSQETKNQQQENQDNHQQDKDDQDQNQSRSDEEKDRQKQEQKEDQAQQGDEKNKDQKQKIPEQTQEEGNDPKTDKQLQAEAILNALKDQEKINQKRQIAKAKSRKLEKDW